MSDWAVEAQQLTKRFPGAQALRGVDLAIPRGVTVGLLGPNGSGKSTLMRILAGVQRPTAGKVRVLGHPPGRVTKERVAYVPEVEHLYRWMDVNEALRFTAAMFDDFNPDRARELLALTALHPEARVGDLSKGYRARLKLVLAMARDAELVLLDEPLSGIDLVSREKVLDGLLRGHRPGETTVFITTHLVREVEPLLDRVAFLKEGRVVLEGEAESLRAERGCSVEDLYREVFA
ncbi:MAG: ABC transporter ATP-binding protein [Bacillota bacterium]